MCLWGGGGVGLVVVMQVASVLWDSVGAGSSCVRVCVRVISWDGGTAGVRLLGS